MVDLTIDKIDAKDINRLAIAHYLADRTFADEHLEEACKKPNKTLDGVMNYIQNQALETVKKEDRHGTVMRMIKDDDVYEWAVHYILEDSLDCEKKAEPVPSKTVQDYLAKYKAEHPVVVEQPKPQNNPQLLFDF